MAYFQGANYKLGLSYAREAHRLWSGHAVPLVIGTACAGLLDNQEAATDLLGRLKSLVPDISRDQSEQHLLSSTPRIGRAWSRDLPVPA